MSLNYARGIPSDENAHQLDGFSPAYKAYAVYSSNNATASSVITLTDSTTMVEITAAGAVVALRWVPSTETAGVAPFASVITTAGSPNFDNIIGLNATRRFVVPQERAGVASIVGAGVRAGTYRRVALMSGVGVSSILVSEF